MRILHKEVLVLFLFGLLTNCAMPTETDEPVVIDGQIEEASQAVTQADKDWWKGLNQLVRNGLIVTRAFQDFTNPPKNVGLNCKEWARKVVSDASKGVVNLPSTSPDANGWKWSSSSYVQKLGSITSTLPGDFVQMNLGIGNPHTAMVLSQNGTDVCWLDSNWNLDNKVTYHCQKISSFLTSVTSGGVQMYTAYHIIGG